MTSVALARGGTHPALRRLEAIGALDQASRDALTEGLKHSRSLKPRRELIREGAPVKERLLLLSGWAARVRMLLDGRRQVISLLLVGDIVGNCRQVEPLAVSTIVALTDVDVCPAPHPRTSPALAEAYAVSHAMDEAYLLAQITRLGRLNAEERLADLLLELLGRLKLCGLAHANGFSLPLTQEVLADATGLSPVHLNRTLQQLRRQGEIVLHANALSFPDPGVLAERVGQAPVRVTEALREARDDTGALITR